MSTNMAIGTRSSTATADRSHRWLVATSCVLWLAVAAAIVYGRLLDEDDWETAYAVFVLALTNAASVTAVTIVGWSRPATRGRTWSVGVAALVVAVLSTLVAWASVLWQASLAVAFVLLAVGTDRPRTPIFALAGAQLAGLAALFIGAGDVSIMLSSLLTAAAVWLTLRSAGEQSDR